MEEVRTRYEIQMDVRFSARYHALCERWLLLLNDANTVFGLLMASSVVVSILNSATWLAVSFACAAALLHAINLGLGSVRRANDHRNQYKQYQELDAKLAGGELSDAEADKEFRKLEVADPAISEAFRRLAYLDNLLSHGHKDEAKEFESTLSWRERVLRSAL